MKYMVAELMFKAQKAWFENGKICLLLDDNREIRFPIEFNKKLREASLEKLIKMELICNGTGIHWPDIDEDLSITGIMEGRYGNA